MNQDEFAETGRRRIRNAESIFRLSAEVRHPSRAQIPLRNRRSRILCFWLVPLGSPLPKESGVRGRLRRGESTKAQNLHLRWVPENASVPDEPPETRGQSRSQPVAGCR